MLPDSQRDRFILRFPLGYPSRDGELDLLQADGAEQDIKAVEQQIPRSVANDLRQSVRQVHISDDVRHYLLDIIEATRNDRGLSIGASPRAALGLQRACQATALLAQRNFVTPADVQALAVPALTHRVSSRSGTNTEHIIRGIIEQVPAPR
jgi:MoxR-like ATPase